MPRVFLSPPHLGGEERGFVEEAFASNYLAPLGPQVDAFEREFRALSGFGHAVALSSGTAAMHLALRVLGVGPGDTVLAPTLTFVGGVSPILFQGATPVFIDAERASWNVDPDLVAAELEHLGRSGTPPKAVVTADLYGQCADLDRILAVCDRHGVAVVSDSAEAVGATCGGRHAGKGAAAAVYSFNGNKILTTSGGGMLCSDDPELIRHARHLAQQAREPGPHYEHAELGYNYRMSNVLAAIGRGQLRVLAARIAARRRVFERYRQGLADLPGLAFMPEAPWGRATRWLTVALLDPVRFGADRETVRLALEREDIESRPAWKPMHLQPLFSGCRVRGGAVAEGIFAKGLCLPSGSAMSDGDLERVIRIVRRCAGEGSGA